MVGIKGLIGLRPVKDKVDEVTCPPYDVIKPGSKLDNFLKKREDSLYHVTLGEDPADALNRLVDSGVLFSDDEPCFYVYEQTFGGKVRIGVLAAVEVTDYSKGEIIRHEKTFDDKTKGRLELRRKIGYNPEPVFLLTKSRIGAVLEDIRQGEHEYEFESDLGMASELHGIKNRIFRVKEDSDEGRELKKLIGENNLYIADGHHRYHASLLNGQSHLIAYIVERAEITAYNRVIKGKIKFDEIKDKLDLIPVDDFKTPAKNSFCIYSRNGAYLLMAKDVPSDVVGRLDCSILEKEFYPHIGVGHDVIMDQKYFDYYPESDLDVMKSKVDEGEYDIAVALHPVSVQELMDVADAGRVDESIVMPEKSTFFSPKILSGLILYKI